MGVESTASGQPPVEYGAWPPSKEMREKLVERIGNNLAALSFFSEKAQRVDDSVATAHAERIEAEAFAVAETSSTSQALRDYTKKASELLLQTLKGSPEASTSAATSAVTTAATPASDSQVFDLSGGKRETLDGKERAEELLAPLLTPGHAYNKVVFSNKAFRKDAAEVAAAALRASKQQLVEADLSDIIAGIMEAEALSSLATICGALEGSRLMALNLSDNALGEKGVRACKAALQGQTSLQRLWFCNNGISAGAATAIKEILPAPKELRLLHFYNNMTGDEGAATLAEVVKSATVLEDFRCSSTRVGTNGGCALAEALLAGSSLQRIDLRDNMFGAEGGEALAKTLAQHKELREVYLADTGLGDEGAMAVAKALASSAPDLEVLDLSGNDITAEAAPALAACIAGKSKLKRLALAENELGDKGAVKVARALQEGHEALEELDLSTNEIGRVGATAAAKAVASKAGLKSINLNGNHISEAGIDAIKEALGKAVDALGPLDDNDEEGDEDADEEEEAEEQEGTSSAVADAVIDKLGKLGL